MRGDIEASVRSRTSNSHFLVSHQASTFPHSYPVGGPIGEANRSLWAMGPEIFRDQLPQGAMNSSFNLPALSVGVRCSAARLVQVHHDQPSVRTQLHQVLPDADISSSQLYLETDAGKGVAVIDLSLVPDEVTSVAPSAP